MAATGRRGSPVEISLVRVEDDEEYYRYYKKTHAFTLSFGDRLIEVTVTEDDTEITRWVRDVYRVHRGRVRAGGHRDLVVSLCAVYPRPALHAMTKRERAAANKRSNYPIAVLCICAGGTRCLILRGREFEYNHYCLRGRLPRPLEDFFADRGNLFVGIGAKRAAETLEAFCKARVANWTELRPLAEAAFGKSEVARVKAGREDPDGLRGMAMLALDGLNAGEKPETAEIVDEYWWPEDEGEEEKTMYAAVDAFLTCEIAEACLGAMKPGG